MKVTQAMERVEHRVVSIYDLIPHERNYNKHPQEQIERVKASLRRFSQVDDAVVKALPDGKYKIAAHECVTTAALQLLEAGECPHLAQWGITIVPMHWTETDVLGYMAASNETARLSNPDQAELAQLLQEQQDAGFDLEALGSDDETLRQMLEMLSDAYAGESAERDETEDELPEQVETRAKVGDVWQLGRHKIACIDSCNPEQVKRFVGDVAVSFVWADPPYGIDMVGKQRWMGDSRPFGGVKNRGKKPDIKVDVYPAIIGDESANTAIHSFRLCFSLFPNALQIWWGANNYANALPPSTCWLVWDKENTGDFADAELAWCSDKSPVRIFKHMWNGMLKDSEHGQKRVHPSQKPVALAEWAFEKYGKEQDIIFDPFLGSGMSIIAAENLERTVYGCELSPEYIDVIMTRFTSMFGIEPVLLERLEVVNAQ